MTSTRRAHAGGTAPGGSNRRGAAPAPAATGSSLFAGVVGNVLEWYDFAVFGYFAPIIAEAFFPSASRFASLLSAFGVFAGGYLMRPVGGLLFGQIGDRLGRKTALQLSVMLMAVPTMLIGMLPTYAQVGAVAPAALILLRLVQGLSVGGELVGSMTYLSEIADGERRGRVGSLSLCSSTAGVLLGSLVATALGAALSSTALHTWGWRLPFLAGIAIAGVGLWMRRAMPETQAFDRLRRAGAGSARPARELFWTAPGRVLHVAALVMLVGGGFYLLFVWWPTMLSQLLDPPVPHALLVNSLAMTVLMATIPLAGGLSDVVGRRAVMLTAAALLAVLAYPLFHLVNHGVFAGALAAQVIFAVLLGCATGPAPAAMIELFPARLRYTGVAVGYNISLSLFGGTAPLVATWLVQRTGQITTPAYYLDALALATAAAAYFLPRPVDTALQREEADARARRPVLFPPPPR